MILLNLLKDGKKNAITLSCDDGTVHDRRLIDIMDKYGIRGSFHLNSGWLGDENHVSSKEIKALYKNHEVSCHGVWHGPLDLLTQIGVVTEIVENRRSLEKSCGYPVRGLSYANGRYDAAAIDILKNCGIEYSRTTKNTLSFLFPKNYLEWHPTCHHRDCLEYGKKFMEAIARFSSGPRLLYVWGHSYEFDRNNNWELIEEFCKQVGGRDDIWYATNIEICEYIKAQKSLVVSVDEKNIYNPSAQEVWFTDADTGKVYSVKPGEMLLKN
jgi:hypothetical protein